MVETVFASVASLVLISSAHPESCVSHADTPLGVENLSVQDFEVVSAHAHQRTERGSFPDGTILSATNQSCLGDILDIRVNLMPDSQTAMRLTQINGLIDRLTACTPDDYARADRVRLSATEAIDAAARLNETLFISNARCQASLAVEPGDKGRMIVRYQIQTHRP